MTQVRPDPKAGPRVKATDWPALYEAKMGPCRVCGVRLQDWAMSLHHVLSKSLGGGDVEENLVPLCGSGTTGCHGLIEAHDATAGWKLRQAFQAEEIAYVARVKGFDYLDRRYGEYSRPLGEPARGPGAAPDPARLTERAGGPESTPTDTVDRSAAARSTVLASPPPLDETDGRSAGERGSRTKAEEGEPNLCPACGKELPAEPGGTSAVASVPGEEREKPRRKKSWRIAVPADAEDGKAVLDGLVDACRVELAPSMGYEADVPPYFVLTAVLAAFLRGEKAQAA